MPLDESTYRDLLGVRVHAPDKIAAAHAARRRRQSLTRDGMLFIVAADHTARGMVALGDDLLAMANRRVMLERLLTALENPRRRRRPGQRRHHGRPRFLGRSRRPRGGRDHEPGRARGSDVGARRPVHRVRHRAPHRGQPRRRQNAAAHRRRRRRHRADPAQLRARRTATQRPSHDGDGRADPVHEERRRPRRCGITIPTSSCGPWACARLSAARRPIRGSRFRPPPTSAPSRR